MFYAQVFPLFRQQTKKSENIHWETENYTGVLSLAIPPERIQNEPNNKDYQSLCRWRWCQL